MSDQRGPYHRSPGNRLEDRQLGPPLGNPVRVDRSGQVRLGVRGMFTVEDGVGGQVDQVHTGDTACRRDSVGRSDDVTFQITHRVRGVNHEIGSDLVHDTLERSRLGQLDVMSDQTCGRGPMPERAVHLVTIEQ